MITGGVDVARLVYAAHLGLVDEAFRAADGARLGPAGASTDIMGPDGYRTALLFQASMPELRNDPRFPRLCARLGWWSFGSPAASGPIARTRCPTISGKSVNRPRVCPGRSSGFEGATWFKYPRHFMRVVESGILRIRANSSQSTRAPVRWLLGKSIRPAGGQFPPNMRHR